jgi:hypothetical protein
MPREITQQVGQAPLFPVAENGLHPRQGRHLHRRPLDIAAGDPEGRGGVFPGQAAHSLASLLIGPGSDGAGVHHNQVRDFFRRGGAPAPER